jgi:hypothetical protein
MICPQCGKSYEQRLDCPLCGVRLLFHGARAGGRRFVAASWRWRQTVWGRVVLGLFLAQGLLYALRQLLTGLLLALSADGNPQEAWASPGGVVLLEGLRLSTLLVGALFAGGGHRQGLLLGTVVGAANAVLTLLLQPGPSPFVSTVEMYGQPMLQGVVGALGGGLGCFLWRPLPAASRGLDQKRKREFVRPNLLAGRIAWIRVAVGVGIAVAGTLSALALFEMALDVSAGKLGTTDELQDRFVTWEIKTLALLLGGAFAGATTNNGLKQGLVVGVATSVILVGIQISRLDQWEPVAVLTMASALTLSLAGGWFGSQLFPPVVNFRGRSRLGPAM